uniref:Uncharacterized protein n=2 Tax=Ceratitis capitata TaxID=7213 RepID=W8BNE0_CERCA
MENNEITIFMDVKLDIHSKRPCSLKFKQWSRCEVKIEGIKCFPSFLRVTITGCNTAEGCLTEEDRVESRKYISVSIIVPGVSINLAASRTKEFSYGLFWTQYRKPCYIYFALETEISCRRHMKWIKKTIKNLELHRQLILEQNRISRGPSMGVAGVHTAQVGKENIKTRTKNVYEPSTENLYSSLGPLPTIPGFQDSNQSGWSRQNSDIYEEILEYVDGQPRLSRRISRASIASGIYEEMKPSPQAFNSIDEESIELQQPFATGKSPPPLPPLPPPRKRINTFDGQGVLGEIPRSNTNPESEFAKKKKYKNVLDNLFGSARAKRAESVSETQACTAEDIINSITPTKIPDENNEETTPIYVNDVAVKHQKKTLYSNMFAGSKRNSFSSPDLSKINYFDTINEKESLVSGLGNSIAYSDNLRLSTDSLENFGITTSKDQTHGRISVDSLNVSEKIPNNFNFSAINSSGINLIGCNGAAIPASNKIKNKILIDDLTGYCVMAPIRPKKSEQITNAEPTTSGYSTVSQPSTSSSSSEDPKVLAKINAHKNSAEESAIYEQMIDLHRGNEANTTINRSTLKSVEDSVTPNSPAYTSTTNISDFTGNLYENLLAVKASQELEQELPIASLSTSTPTESPNTHQIVCNENQTEEEENYYQTPRKSIISVDEKIPSYYPNSCDTAKTRRHHTIATASPQLAAFNTSPSSSTTKTSEKSNNIASSVGLRHLVNLKLRRERKENLYISSPQSIIEQRQSANKPAEVESKIAQKNGRVHKSLRAGALKIAEHVYTVKHAKQKTQSNEKHLNNNNNNNNEPDVANFPEDMRERLQTELLQIALLQKIDFKFDDAKSAEDPKQNTLEDLKTPSPSGRRQQQQQTQLTPAKERTYENLLHRHLQLHQAEQHVVSSASINSPATNTRTRLAMHHSCLTGVGAEDNHNADSGSLGVPESSGVDGQVSGLSSTKKFASLPRFKKIDFSPLRLRINNVLQRAQQQDI